MCRIPCVIGTVSYTHLDVYKRQGCREPVWRYSGNPIIQRDAIPTSNSIFNSAVAPFRGGFAGIFRCDSRAVEMNIHAGFSEDGLRWRISPQAIRFQGGGEAARYEYCLLYTSRCV